VSSSDLSFEGSRRQLIYIFEGADAPSGSVGPPINLEFRQTITPRFETPNACIIGLCTYSKGILSLPTPCPSSPLSVFAYPPPRLQDLHCMAKKDMSPFMRSVMTSVSHITRSEDSL
jgi:hypothetical protein